MQHVKFGRGREVERSQRPAMHTVSRYNYVGGRCGLAGTAVAAEDCAVVAGGCMNAPRAAANTSPGSRAQIAVSGCDMTLAFSAYDSVFALLDCLAACQSHVIINSVAHLFKLSLHLAAGVRHLGRLGHVFVKLILAERII